MFPKKVYFRHNATKYSYEKETGVKVNYQSIGSGGGIKQITAGTVDFGASDDPLTQADLDKRHDKRVNKIGRQRAQSGLYSNSRDACNSYRVNGINDKY